MSRREYTPRPYAPLAMAHMRNVPRCALWAGMGMGKTAMVMTHLDTRHRVWGESRPTLILGPKRVARHVWTDEVGKWQHLAGLDVVSMCGTLAERQAALRVDAPVKTINYDNLPWLVDQFPKGAWPFRLVVADEATRLKSFRSRQGGARARALGTVAHTLCDEFIQLTGTPSPNGLIDLWGQMWFLDQGARLGRTFSAFEARYFAWKSAADAATGGKKGQVKQIILPHSGELIHEKLADICLTLDPRDWFDIRAPRVNVIEVDLPPKARAQYKEFERTMFLALGDDEIEAFSAAAKTMKCLQLANGAVYLEDGTSWAGVHDAKLEALESVIEEAGGSPVLVAYHFKSDLARLKTHFPDGLDLSTDAGMAQAKAGRGRVWFGHPASMGHGVDGLQEHCATVCFFGHWWDLEQHDQFVERVGPMRQLQAGKNRAVTIHYLVARGTVDQVVVARHESKRGVQDLLLEYMKRKGTP
jgi:hypothetical protein